MFNPKYIKYQRFVKYLKSIDDKMVLRVMEDSLTSDLNSLVQERISGGRTCRYHEKENSLLKRLEAVQKKLKAIGEEVTAYDEN
jgi:hypothetical protein